MKKIISILLLFLGVGFFLLNTQDSANAFFRISDRISTSWPNTGASHVFQFRNFMEIPAGGKIVLDFDDEFTFFDEMDFTDIDFAVADNSSGPYVDRDLLATSSDIVDGITIATGTKSIDIILNNSNGIDANSYLQVIVGSQAAYGVIGTRNVIKPEIVGSYRINMNAYDAGGNYQEAASVSIAVIDPVGMTTYSKTRYLGASPIGWLNYGTVQTIMSMATNYPARCRYSTASNTPFSSMTDDFTYASSTKYYYSHTVFIDNLTNGGEYDFYVRCTDQFGERDIVNDCFYSSASTTPYFTASGTPITFLECTDYYIHFAVTKLAGEGGGPDGGGGGDDPSVPGSGVSTGGGSGSGSGGGGGGGVGSAPAMYLPYPPPPGAPGVVFTGWAYPGKEVVFLQDGVEQGRVLAKSDASFSAYVEELNRGVYTFGIWSEDPKKRRSNTFSTTFWLEAGTQTTVSDIILAPTISLVSASITSGQILEVSGHTAPESSVEVWLYPEKSAKVLEAEIVKKSGLSTKTGDWSLYLDTNGVSDGPYLVKARTTIGSKGTSDFGKILKVSIGAAPVVKEGVCAGSDLNADGKVNLTDFSILLYHWGSGHECADQNHDGIVNLTDFSIMMFYWTG